MHRMHAGPITRVEALEIPKLIDEVRVDLRDPKIGMLDPQIELYGYETMAQLERALPAHLDDLASTRRDRAGLLCMSMSYAAVTCYLIAESLRRGLCAARCALMLYDAYCWTEWHPSQTARLPVNVEASVARSLLRLSVTREVADAHESGSRRPSRSEGLAHGQALASLLTSPALHAGTLPGFINSP